MTDKKPHILMLFDDAIDSSSAKTTLAIAPTQESDRQYLFKSNKPFNNFYVLPANTSPNTFMRAVDAASQEIVIF